VFVRDSRSDVDAFYSDPLGNGAGVGTCSRRKRWS
jgi:hypothetical protein